MGHNPLLLTIGDGKRAANADTQFAVRPTREMCSRWFYISHRDLVGSSTYVCNNYFLAFLAVAVVALSFSQAANAEKWTIIPQISVTETYTDNAELKPDALARRSWISDLAPGIRVEHRSPKSNIFLDYRLHNIYFSEASRLNNTQNSLNSHANLEALENWLFFDAQATVSQQNRSAFSSATTAAAITRDSKNSNAVETTSYQAAPYIRGKWSDVAIYQLRYNHTNSRTNDAALPNTNIAEWIAKLKSNPSSAALGWSFDANVSNIHNQVVGRLEDDRAVATLIYSVNPQFHFSALAGRGSTNYVSANKQQSTIRGVGIEWAPSPRTQLAAVMQKRFFGDAYSVILSHRTPLTAWRLGSNKDVVLMPNVLASSSAGAVSNVMFDLLASAIPDPALRKEEVTKRLAQTGIPPNPSISGGFLTARPSLNRSREASVAILGTANTLTVTYSKKDQRSLAAASSIINTSFSDDVQQRNWNAALSHKITPLTNLVFIASQLNTDGLSITRPRSKQTFFSLFLTTPFGPKTTLSLGSRRVRFESSVATDYHENALVALLTARF